MNACVLHSFSPATHQCSGCGRHLCEDCGTRLPFCGACGARVLRYGEEAPPGWADRMLASSFLGGTTDPATWITLHAIIPAAIISMVFSMLYYLLLVRSIFFGGSRALAWIGFWFIVATVLTARYGRTRRDRVTQLVYTGILFGAAALAIFARSASTAAALWSIALLAVVWLYSTAVTNALSLERGPEEVERSAFVPIAGLGVLALVVFAFAEPFMLNAPPEVTIQAMLAMIGFLLSTGVTLAAGAATGQARRAFRADGEVALRVMPLRIAAAAVVALALLSMALAAPAVTYSGTGRISLSPDGVLDPRRITFGATERGGQIANELVEGLPWGWLGAFDARRPSSVAGGFAFAVVRHLQLAGALLAGLLALALIGFAIQRRSALARRLGPLMGRSFAWLRDRWRALAPEGATAGSVRTRPIDPFADIEGLRAKPPRQAVADVYVRSVALCERLGHPRRPSATPHDLLRTLPAELIHLSEALARITSIYVRAAYSNDPVGADDRDGAIATLLDLRERSATSGATAAG